MVIVIDENRIETILNRLCSVGLPRTVAGALFDLPRSSAYNLTSNEYSEHEEPKFCNEARDSLELVDKAEALLKEGYPLDMVCQITRIPANKLLYFLDETIET